MAGIVKFQLRFLALFFLIFGLFWCWDFGAGFVGVGCRFGRVGWSGVLRLVFCGGVWVLEVVWGISVKFFLPSC